VSLFLLLAPFFATLWEGACVAIGLVWSWRPRKLGGRDNYSENEIVLRALLPGFFFAKLFAGLLNYGFVAVTVAGFWCGGLRDFGAGSGSKD
jgi:NhaP-type Na+/H+ or K+/H+ antiporter